MPKLRQYLRETREPYANAVLVFPLFIFYQIGVLATDGVRNGVDFMTDLLFLAAGGEYFTYVAINLALLAGLGIAILVLRRKGDFHLRTWPWVVAESTLYAFFFGSIILTVMQELGIGATLASGAAARGVLDSLVLSVGAGIYEEIVFRLVLTGGLIWIGNRFVKAPGWLIAVGAVVASSLLFSAIHYVGTLGDTLTLASFVFRFFAGVLLAAIFYLRGFAVAVYTHAIYDVLVMLGP